MSTNTNIQLSKRLLPGKPTLFQLATIKAVHDLDRACIQLNETAKRFVSNPTLDCFASFCLASRIAWHECYDSALMDGEFSRRHVESFISCSCRQDVTEAIQSILSKSPIAARGLAEHYAANIQRRLQFAKMAMQGGLAAVYDDQRRESLRQIQQSDIPMVALRKVAIERALNVDDVLTAPSDGSRSSDDGSLLNLAQTTFSWLRHRLLLQLTELLFERGPYAAAVASHLTIARSIRHCFKIALQISDDSAGSTSAMPSICRELPALLAMFDKTIVATLERATSEVEGKSPQLCDSAEELESRAHGHLVDTFVHVSDLLERLCECSELLRSERGGSPALGPSEKPVRVLLYKRGNVHFAHDLDADLIAHDENGYEEAIATLVEMREVSDSAQAENADAIVVAPEPAPERLLKVFQQSAPYLSKASVGQSPIDARRES